MNKYYIYGTWTPPGGLLDLHRMITDRIEESLLSMG